MLKTIKYGLLFGLLLVSAVRADEDIDQNKAQALRDQGRILSLDKILGTVTQAHPGRVMEVELEEKHNRYVYEIELVDSKGKVWEVKVDAATGSLISSEQDD
ncbi:MAG: PepSY domain-containing protein [Gammaproteobacteria bacterium]|jgi:uncharacterized membrane protein YkoI